MNDEGYTKVKNTLITSSELDSAEFRILTYLISISKKGICYPSIRTLANLLNKSPTSISKYLNNLVKKEFILKENRVTGKGKKTSNVYLINEDAISKNIEKEKKSNKNVSSNSPKWLNQEIQKEEMTDDELQEMEDLLVKFRSEQK